MKRNVKKSMFMMLAFIMLLAISGCGNLTEPPQTAVVPTDVTIIIGNHSNAQAYNTSGSVREAVTAACQTAGHVNIIVSDGDPYLAAEIKAPPIKNNVTDSKAEQVVNNNADQIVALLTSDETKAKTPETDVIQALNMASRTKAESEDNILIVMDPGVSTSGSISLAGTLLNTIDIDKTVETLRCNSSIPDLSRFNKAIWIGIGAVCGDQARFTDKEIQLLKSLWGAVLSQSGVGEFEFSEDLPVGEMAYTSLPPVSTVPTAELESAISTFAPEKAVVLDDTTLHFKPGSDELLTDISSVQTILSPITDYLKENPASKILLAGTTASAGTEAYLKDLSFRRGQKIKEVILSMADVRDDQIKVIGTGINNPFYEYDKMPDGSLDPEIAQRNRSVIISGYDSETSKTLINF